MPLKNKTLHLHSLVDHLGKKYEEQYLEQELDMNPFVVGSGVVISVFLISNTSHWR